jgi:hypothetical protein
MMGDKKVFRTHTYDARTCDVGNVFCQCVLCMWFFMRLLAVIVMYHISRQARASQRSPAAAITSLYNIRSFLPGSSSCTAHVVKTLLLSTKLSTIN